MEVQGESRLCIAVVDPLKRSQTEINEAGPTVSTSEVAHLAERVSELSRSLRPFCVVFSGSLPPGAPLSLYGELIEIAHGARVRTVLDTSGPALSHGLSAVPWMLKPNLAELAWFTGKKSESDESIIARARRITRTGDRIVVVTRGEKGCIGVSNEGAWAAVPPEVEFVSAVPGDTTGEASPRLAIVLVDVTRESLPVAERFLASGVPVDAAIVA